MTINVFFRKQGRYDILETIDFGYRLSIITNIQPMQNRDGSLTISYNPYKAYMKANDKGYMTLYINE